MVQELKEDPALVSPQQLVVHKRSDDGRFTNHDRSYGSDIVVDHDWRFANGDGQTYVILIPSIGMYIYFLYMI